MPERGDSQRRSWLAIKYGKVHVTGLIIDYIEDSRFEGRIIEHTWNNMGWKPILLDKPRGNWKAGEAIATVGPKCNVIHITAHGNLGGASRDTCGEEAFSLDALEWLFDFDGPGKKLKGVTLVVNSACNSYASSWTDLFIKTLGVKCYVGAKGKPALDEGIVFPVAFYLKLWGKKRLTKQAIARAFKEAKKSVHTDAGWKLKTRD
jgi:hypothetical protein